MLSSNIKASFTPTSTTLLSIFKLSAFTFDHTREKKNKYKMEQNTQSETFSVELFESGPKRILNATKRWRNR